MINKDNVNFFVSEQKKKKKTQQQLTKCNFPNCRNRLIRAPLPKELVMLAWYAKVGNSAESNLTHFRVTQLGTKSHLLITITKCL